MFDHFAKEKSDFLKKKDKSKKGNVDDDIKEIVDVINSKNNYYTTSSCAGRIVLFEMKSRKKNECYWIFAKHDKVKVDEIVESLKKHYDKKNQTRELPLKGGLREANVAQRVNGAMPLEDTSFEYTGFKYQIWFKQQPIILHIACRNLDAAKKLMDFSRKIFRRAGIIGITNRKIMVEIIGDERLETIVADNNFVADDKYIKELIKYANENFEENKKKGEKFLRILRKI